MKPLFIIFLLSVVTSYAQVDITKLHSNYVLKENREKYKTLIQDKVESFASKSPTRGTEKAWMSLFRELELTLTHNSSVDSIIRTSINYANIGSNRFQRSTIELAYTFNHYQSSSSILDILNRTNDRQTFCIAAHYLLNSPNPIIDTNTVVDLVFKKFPKYKNDPVIKFLHYDLTNPTDNFITEDELIELLAHPFQKNKTIIYSIHRKDRSIPGITIIKKPDGTFVRNPDSSIFYIPQLAASTSNLPGYLSQGNTPQGIFTVVGTYVSRTASIGPTPNVLTRIPFEVEPALFYHGRNTSNKWELTDYKNLLPVSLQNYLPLYEAYYAGSTGRRLIVMHGSTDDLSFFTDKSYYPLTPSKGCLTSTEIWDEETGKLIRSDQVKLMNAFHASGNLYGFLVVINIDDKKQPVDINELLPIILDAEK
jgi:hypothetical protein